jgi:hypothetical protein
MPARRIAVIGLASWVAAGAILRADNKPPAAPNPAPNAAKPVAAPDARKAAVNAVNAAVAGLTKEWQAHQKDPKAPLRIKCDYFIEKNAPDVTPEAIVAALPHAQANEVVADAYIKWQLLSGIKGKADVKLVPQLLAAYRVSAGPIARPGLSAADKRELDQLIRDATAKDAAGINARLHKQVDEVLAMDQPILSYREEAFARLPSSEDVLLAGLADGVERAACGIDSERFTKNVMGEMLVWSVTTSPQQIHVLADALRQVIDRAGGLSENADVGGTDDVAMGFGPIFLLKTGPKIAAKKTFPPPFYLLTEWEEKNKRLVWKEGEARFPSNRVLSGTYKDLDDTATKLAAMKIK